MTFSQDIEQEAGEEKITGCVIGNMGWGDYGSESIPNYDKIPKGKLLSWEEARPHLDYNYDAGYGAPGCNCIHAWTKSKVIAVGQYDGATWIYSIPRNPTDIMPSMEGGG